MEKNDRLPLHDYLDEIHEKYLNADQEAFDLRMEAIDLKSDLMARTQSHDLLIKEIFRISEQLLNLKDGHCLLGLAMAQKKRYGTTTEDKPGDSEE